jgi:hypothetical protein
MVATAIGGGIVGALLTAATTQHTPTAATTSTTGPAPADTHTQDVRLCTAFAIINASTPAEDQKASDLLPATTALRQAVAASPGASAEIRDAVGALADAYAARMASYAPVRTRGLAEPPAYDKDQAQTAYDRAWDACRLGD